ncbi:RxLR effector protein [Phytophthora cinnamomi]|uniref:RxLR effector protein n=1 Tax=Phytophthora cinnamomi TaxID=4785 RepID=UPI0035599410|nr:RxLR effector protein [Phytophthora cinnamomi]
MENTATSTVEHFDAHTSRHLRIRTHNSAETILEERGFSVAELVAKITKKPSNQKEVTNLFAKLKLFNERAKLFENAQFAEWTKAVEKGYKTNPEAALTAMVSTLRHQYRDEALVDMIAAAKKVAGTKDTATKLEKAQMKSWLSEEKSVEDAFRVFKLDKDKYSILSSPLLQNWVSYAKMTGTDPYKWLFAKMKAQKLDDSTIANVVGSPTQNPATAERLAGVLFDSWKPQSASYIFVLLKLGNEDELLFTLPRLRTWMSYATKLGGGNADEQIYKILRKAYGDADLAAKLAVSKQYSVGDVVTRLEKAQQKVLLSEKKPADEIFNMWKLNGQGDKLFENPAVATWVAYVTKLDAKNADETMLSVLKTAYKDDTLALTKMLAAAKDNADTKAIADKLEEALYKDWRSSGKSADDVFALLKLDDEMDDLLSNPVLNNWVTYVENLQQNPYSELLAKLKSSKLSGTDAKLAKTLVKAQQNAKTRYLKAIAEKLQVELWLSQRKTPEDVFNSLGIFQSWVTLFEEPAFPSPGIMRGTCANVRRRKEVREYKGDSYQTGDSIASQQKK